MVEREDMVLAGLDSRLALIHGGIEGAALASMLSGMGMMGLLPIVIGDEPSFEHEYRYRDRASDLIDRLDVLSAILPSGGRDKPKPFKLRPRTGYVEHTATDKRPSKRRARRLRGRAAVLVRKDPTHDR